MAGQVNSGGAPRTYFDAATAAPLHPVARQAMLAALEDGWADPTKLYAQSRRAAQLVDASRAAIADELGVRTDEVVFTSGAGRAAQLAIQGVRRARARIGDTVVHSAVEHSSILRAAQEGPTIGVPVDRLGRIEVDSFRAAVTGGGIAAAVVQSANHEVGTRQPIAEVVAAAGDVPVLVDAAASVGHAAVPPGASMLVASAVKWGGPAGIGVLVVRKGVRFERPWPVDRLDPEPISVPLAVAAAAALRAVVEAGIADTPAGTTGEAARQFALVDRIRARVAASVPDVEIVGDAVDRLPHIVTFSCLYVDGEALLHALDRYGFAVSSGSACTAATLRPSHVLEAMGVLSHGNVRVSLHPGVSEADVDRFLDVLPGVVAELRAEAGVADL